MCYLSFFNLILNLGDVFIVLHILLKWLNSVA